MFPESVEDSSPEELRTKKRQWDILQSRERNEAKLLPSINGGGGGGGKSPQKKR